MFSLYFSFPYLLQTQKCPWICDCCCYCLLVLSPVYVPRTRGTCPLSVCQYPLSARSVSGQTLTDRLFSSLSGGELFERITAEGYTMSEAEVINYMRQICEGVKHMHERNIIHLGK